MSCVEQSLFEPEDHAGIALFKNLCDLMIGQFYQTMTICGGAAAHFAFKDPTWSDKNDIDFFIMCGDDTKQNKVKNDILEILEPIFAFHLRKRVNGLYYYKLKMNGPSVISMVGQHGARTMQFIFSASKSIEELWNNFDFHFCKAAIMINTMYGQSYAGTPIVDDLATKEWSSKTYSIFPLKNKRLLPQRILKASAKGFKQCEKTKYFFENQCINSETLLNNAPKNVSTSTELQYAKEIHKVKTMRYAWSSPVNFCTYYHETFNASSDWFCVAFSQIDLFMASQTAQREKKLAPQLEFLYDGMSSPIQLQFPELEVFSKSMCNIIDNDSAKMYFDTMEKFNPQDDSRMYDTFYTLGSQLDLYNYKKYNAFYVTSIKKRDGSVFDVKKGDRLTNVRGVLYTSQPGQPDQCKWRLFVD